jgi:hypothetical protein
LADKQIYQSVNKQVNHDYVDNILDHEPKHVSFYHDNLYYVLDYVTIYINITFDNNNLHDQLDYVTVNNNIAFHNYRIYY